MGGPSRTIQSKPYKSVFKAPNRPNLIYANCVYYPNWKVYRQRPPSSMSLAYISHIFYAFAWQDNFHSMPTLPD